MRMNEKDSSNKLFVKKGSPFLNMFRILYINYCNTCCFCFEKERILVFDTLRSQVLSSGPCPPVFMLWDEFHGHSSQLVHFLIISQFHPGTLSVALPICSNCINIPTPARRPLHHSLSLFSASPIFLIVSYMCCFEYGVILS